ATAIGLTNAIVFYYQDGNFKWMYSNTLKTNEDTARTLYASARAVAPGVYREDHKGNIIVASYYESPYSQAVFSQLLPNEIAQLKSERELQDEIFADNDKFLQSVNGCLSTMRQKLVKKGMSSEQCLEAFWARYGTKFPPAQRAALKSAAGERY